MNNRGDWTVCRRTPQLTSSAWRDCRNLPCRLVGGKVMGWKKAGCANLCVLAELLPSLAAPTTSAVGNASLSLTRTRFATTLPHPPPGIITTRVAVVAIVGFLQSTQLLLKVCGDSFLPSLSRNLASLANEWSRGFWRPEKATLVPTADCVELREEILLQDLPARAHGILSCGGGGGGLLCTRRRRHVCRGSEKPRSYPARVRSPDVGKAR